MRVHGEPTDEIFAPLRKGIVVEGERFQPMTVTLDRQQGANAWITVSLKEGKNREVRRAMESVGLTVNRLIRVSYGPFRLGELKAGQVEEVRPRVLRDQLGLDETPRPEGRAHARRAGQGRGAQGMSAGRGFRADSGGGPPIASARRVTYVGATKGFAPPCRDLCWPFCSPSPPLPR